MDKKVKIELDNIVQTLVDTGTVLQIFLFGSYAKGEETQDSDIDLCVLTSIKDQHPIDIAVDYRLKICSVRKTPVDLFAYNKETFYDIAYNHPKSFAREIANNGVLLYGNGQP